MDNKLLSTFIDAFISATEQLGNNCGLASASAEWNFLCTFSDNELNVVIPLLIEHLKKYGLSLNLVLNHEKIETILRICLKTNNEIEILKALDLVYFVDDDFIPSTDTEFRFYLFHIRLAQDEILKFILNHNIALKLNNFKLEHENEIKNDIAKITKQRELMQQTVYEFLTTKEFYMRFSLWDKNVSQIIKDYVSF